MLILSSLLLNSSFAAPVIVAKTLGLPKISQSYALSEDLVDALQKEYEFDVALLVENPCSDIACQQETAKKANPLWLVQVVIAADKKSAELTLFDMEKQRARKTKTVTGESWDEVRAKLPTSLVKLSKRRFSKITPDTELPTKEREEPTDDFRSTKNIEDMAEDIEDIAKDIENIAEDTIIPKAMSLFSPDSKPFEGLRTRASGALGMYQYNQSSEDATEHISPDVALQTILPDLRVGAEYWLESNQIGFLAEAGIAPFGYKLGDDSTIKTISNLRVGLAYHHPLSKSISLEVGLAYHSTHGMDFRFAEERTKVDAFTQSIKGGALSVGIVTRISDIDIRTDLSETFAPLPEQTRIRVYGEKPLSTLSGNMMLTAHGGLQLTMRHFGFEVQSETGSVFDLQAGLFGGAGVSF